MYNPKIGSIRAPCFTRLIERMKDNAFVSPGSHSKAKDFKIAMHVRREDAEMRKALNLQTQATIVLITDSGDVLRDARNLSKEIDFGLTYLQFGMNVFKPKSAGQENFIELRDTSDLAQILEH